MKVQAEIGEPNEPIDRSTIDVGSLDELGLRVAESPRIDSAFARWATRDSLEKQQTRKQRIANIIDMATAVVLVGAVAATMGGALAAAAALGGMSAVGAVSSAGVRVSNAADLQTKSAAGFNPEDNLTSDAKVASAELEAGIAVVTAILAVAGAVKLGAMAGLFRASSVAEDLARLGSLSPSQAAKVVQVSIRECGVLSTAQQAGYGNDVYQLAKHLPEGSTEIAEVLRVAELISQGRVAGVSGSLWRPELTGARRRATLVELRQWLKGGGRFYTHRTADLNVVMNDVIRPMELPPNLRPNPTAPQGVYFMARLEGQNYGPYCFVVNEAELGAANEIKPGEFLSNRAFGRMWVIGSTSTI